MTVVIRGASSPVARCRHCGVQRQFHTKSGVVFSADRDHLFVAETIADYEPADLSPGQLVKEIFDQPNSPRAIACGAELRDRVRKILGVDFEDLQEALW